MRRTSVLLNATLALAIAASAVAQQPAPQPRRNAANPGMAERMLGARNPAERLLAFREQLALTDDQVKRLQALGTSQTEALRPNRPAMLRAQADLAEAMQKENLDAAHTAMTRLATLRTDAAFARLKADKDARDVLTTEQKSKLQQFGAMRRMQMRNRMRGGMGGQGGMMGPRMRMRPGMGPMGAMGPGMGPMGGPMGPMNGQRMPNRPPQAREQP